jgi:hypothetical protein
MDYSAFFAGLWIGALAAALIMILIGAWAEAGVPDGNDGYDGEGEP